MTQVTNRTETEAAEMDEFARNLLELMARKGVSQSDVARAVWGSATDNRGRDVARNRDRISNYVRGKQLPEPKTIKKLADVLGVTPSELYPALGKPEGRNAPADVSLTAVGGRPDMAFLVVNKMLPMNVAVKILSMIADVKDK
jgi:transcriptional regulator with XRE-family HTH domain